MGLRGLGSKDFRGFGGLGFEGLGQDKSGGLLLFLASSRWQEGGGGSCLRFKGLRGGGGCII